MLWSDPNQGSTDHKLLSGARVPFVPNTSSGHQSSSLDRNRSSYVASLVEIPFLYKRTLLICFVACAILGWLAILVWPRTYESQAKIIVRIGRESVSLDPSATTSATLTLQKTQEEDVVSALEILGSRRVADAVVEKLGADAILEGVLAGEGGSDSPSSDGLLSQLASKGSDLLWTVLSTTGFKDDISSHELAVMRLQSSLTIQSPKKTAVIVIHATSKTPEMAQAIARTVTETFMDEHLKASRIEGSFAFFEEKTLEAETRLNELVDKRAQFMQERKLVSIEAGREALQQRLSAIDRDLIVANGDLEQAKSEIGDLGTKVTVTDDEVVATKVAGSDSTWSGMRQKVYDLEIQEQNLSAQLTAGHPKLIQIREQLAGAREILGNLKSERVDENKTPNPVKTALYQELQRQQTKIAGLNSVIESKLMQKEEMQQQIDRLLEDERALTSIDREIRTMEAKLRVMREKLEEARVIEGLQEQKISNLHVFQQASLVERAMSPNKKLLLAGFLMLGLVAGTSLCFVGHTFSSTFRTTADVEMRLAYPVVASIPKLSQKEAARNQGQEIGRQAYKDIISEILLSRRNTRSDLGRSVGIIGVDLDVGASTFAANLAVASGMDCRLKTVLVDADLRCRGISRMFGLRGAPGLLELVNGSASHDECLQRVNRLPIDLVASTQYASEEVWANDTTDMVQALRVYQQDCDILIVDLPAASEPDQAIALAQSLDIVFVVVEASKTDRASTERLLKRLSDSDAQFVGIVLNKTQSALPRIIRRFLGQGAW